MYTVQNPSRNFVLHNAWCALYSIRDPERLSSGNRAVHTIEAETSLGVRTGCVCVMRSCAVTERVVYKTYISTNLALCLRTMKRSLNLPPEERQGGCMQCNDCMHPLWVA
jgi:hypothetical protein